MKTMSTPRQLHRYIVCLIVQLILPVLPNAAYPWSILTEALDLTCMQTQPESLACDYRMRVPEPPLAISAAIGNNKLTVTEAEIYPWPQAVTAILFLVDTSDPAREPVIRMNIQHLSSLLAVSRDYQQLGLASFDKSLRMEAPIGTSKNQILAAAQHLRATGMTTELYRSVIQAISLLQTVAADRKVIYLFSDGLAEDKAYFHGDVIKAAQNARVIINSLGYPRSIPASVALQTLRRLSEETGGIYIESDHQFDLPSGFIDLPYDNIDNGGRINIDLLPAIAAGLMDTAELQLAFETDLGDIQIQVPVRLPSPEKKPDTGTPTLIPAEPVISAASIKTRPAVVTAPVQVVTRLPDSRAADLWLWYGVPAVLIILIIMVLLTMSLVFWQRQGGRKKATDSQAGYKPYAYLISQDETATRYPITRTIWRIGRSKDNELTLRDNSVSRRHAEIHRKRNGKFDIVDLESVNGVYVNTEKITKSDLKEGDLIEIGDITLLFTQYSSDYSAEESTVMQMTKAPVSH